MLNQKHKYAPDVLDCISNLSNDEVFTSPKLANQILDMLPQELFTNPRTKFLDPCCKSGVFLREITKRLDKGLEDIIPDKQQRIDHILHNQVFGIAITELTAQLSRRTLYCSKYACAINDDIDEALWENEKGETLLAHSYSISEFTKKDENDFCLNAIQGNIRFNRKIKHDYSKGDTCLLCGASKKENSEYDHAYELIHIQEKQLEVLKNMRFDVIIGNPPYQLKDGGGTGDSAKPIYNKFIEQAQKLESRYLAMIVPSRWMKGGKGLDGFRESMMKNTMISKMVDYEKAEDCFTGVHIDGGVCYFLIDKSHNGECDFKHICANGYVDMSKRYLDSHLTNTIIRDSRQISIIKKANADKKLSEIVSARNPYGFCADFFNTPENYPDVDVKDEKDEKHNIEIFGVKGKKGGAKRTSGFIEKDKIKKNQESIEKYKLFFSKAYLTTSTVPPEIIKAKKNQICTETFLQIGSFNTEQEMENALSYLKTKFARALLFYNRHSLNISQESFSLIPLVDFNEKWTDEKLYKKYKLNDDEIKFIEENIGEMKDAKEE